MTPLRRSELLELSVHELVRRLMFADHVERQLRAELVEVRNENEALRSAFTNAMCGELLGWKTSCQRERGHDGLHMWRAHDTDHVIRW